VTIGWMQFGSTSSDGFSGLCAWDQTPAAQARSYAGGVTNGVTITGSLYKAPPVAFRNFGRSKVILNGGRTACSNHE